MSDIVPKKRLPLTVLTLSCLTLSACMSSERSMIMKPGGTITQRDADMITCQTDALKQVPREMITKVTPTYTTKEERAPEHTYCTDESGKMKCTTTGGEIIRASEVRGGKPYSYDANQSLRQKTVALCMHNKGYGVAELPSCSRDEATSAIPFAGRPFPHTSQIHCITSDERHYVPAP